MIRFLDSKDDVFNRKRQGILKGLATHITLNYHETLIMTVSWKYNIFLLYAIPYFRVNDNNFKKSHFKIYMRFALY